jgi:hypothetical protein
VTYFLPGRRSEGSISICPRSLSQVLLRADIYVSQARADVNLPGFPLSGDDASHFRINMPTNP